MARGAMQCSAKLNALPPPQALDGNDTSLIQRKEKTNFADQATEFLSGATGVNKTDSASLLTQFTSVRAIAAASQVGTN